MTETVWSVTEEEAGGRVDRSIAVHFDVTRNRAQRWIREGLVRVGGEIPKVSLTLKEGDEVQCTPPPRPIEDRVIPEAGELEILHEDEDLIIVNKPPDLTVHPGAGRSEGTLAHRLLHRYPELSGVGGPGRPGIVHRLDKDTSGVMAIARTDASYRSLQRAFEERRTEKIYLALAYGRVVPPSGKIDQPIGRHPRRRKEMTVRDDGRPAITEYEVLGDASGISLFRVRILTGRTHQIRVHLKAIRHPLVGDPVYGESRFREAPPTHRKKLRTFPRPALHAWRLGVPTRSGTQPTEFFEAPIPDDLRELWEALAGAPIEETLLHSEASDQSADPESSERNSS